MVVGTIHVSVRVVGVAPETSKSLPPRSALQQWSPSGAVAAAGHAVNSPSPIVVHGTDAVVVEPIGIKAGVLKRTPGRRQLQECGGGWSYLVQGQPVSVSVVEYTWSS